MAQSITCGYAIAVVLNGSRKYQPINVHDGIVQDLQTIFASYPKFHAYSSSTLREKIKAYLKFIAKHKKNVTVSVKKDVIEEFSSALWHELPEDEKNQHSLNNCKVSIVYLLILCEISNFVTLRYL